MVMLSSSLDSILSEKVDTFSLIFYNLYAILAIYFTVLAIIVALRPSLDLNTNIIKNIMDFTPNKLILFAMCFLIAFQLLFYFSGYYTYIISSALLYDAIFVYSFIKIIIYSTDRKNIIEKIITDLSAKLPQKYIHPYNISKNYTYNPNAFCIDIFSNEKPQYSKNVYEIDFQTYMKYYDVDFKHIEELLSDNDISLIHLYIYNNNVKFKFSSDSIWDENEKKDLIEEFKELIMDEENQKYSAEDYSSELSTYRSLLDNISKKYDLEIVYSTIEKIVDNAPDYDLNYSKNYNILIEEFEKYMISLPKNNECLTYFINRLSSINMPNNYRNVEKLMNLRFNVLISKLRENSGSDPEYYSILGYKSITQYIGAIILKFDGELKDEYIEKLIDKIMDYYVRYLCQILTLNGLMDIDKQLLIWEELTCSGNHKYGFIDEDDYSIASKKYKLYIKNENVITTLLYAILLYIENKYIDNSWVWAIGKFYDTYNIDDTNRNNEYVISIGLENKRPVLFYLLYWLKLKDIYDIILNSEFKENKENNLFIKDLNELTYKDIEVYGTHRLHFEKFKRDALKIAEEYYKNNEMK
ncbi:hypothetical protein [Methanococcus voltae]|uniref:hypothetical protein n=1 Tax=Methanococcus voltae TaxID=2188 RepID=UPI001AE45073|nr:hypothetical protein [Methanococcus voltae]MBP2173289.1 hypothetical protein [Methanococcus voltae]